MISFWWGNTDYMVKQNDSRMGCRKFIWWTIRGSKEMFGVKNQEKWRVPALFALGPTQNPLKIYLLALVCLDKEQYATYN
jgi:hypothetical protein